jgi:glycosyltransferase involved in cell wall biosynthesis
MSAPRRAVEPTTARPDARGCIWFLVDTSGIGGVERHIATLAQALQARGHTCQIVVYGPHGASQWFEQLHAAGLAARALDNTLGGLLRALRQERPALLHVHGYKASILGRLAGRLAGVPVVASNHESERGHYPLNVYRIADDWLSILSPTIGVSSPIARRIPFNAVHVPNFTEVALNPPSGPLPKAVAFVGRLVAVKQPELFCQLALRAPAGIAFHIWGDGPERAALEQRYAHRVTFHGMVSDLEPAWRQTGLLVMTSQMEGQPYAALEALSRGIPVLSSRVGGMPDIVVPGVSGWLFDDGDIDGALAGLQAWHDLAPHAAGDLRRSCWAHIRANFSQDAILPRLMDVYARAGYR